MDLPRKLALNALYKIDQENAFSNIVLDEILNQNRDKLENRDINFISELVYGVTTWKLTLDEIIQMYSKIKLRKINGWVLNILRLGAYQIVFLDKVPKSAAVNESVNLCKKYANRSSKFVNAILRKINKEDYNKIDEISDQIEKISKKYAMPEWIVSRLLSQYGKEKTEEICKNSNIKPNMSIRVNELKTTKETLKQELEQRAIEVEDGILGDFFSLKNAKNIVNLDLYQKGEISLQDEAAALACVCLDPKQEEYILDACSAPGGKTTYLAEKMQNKGEIIAWDVYQNRIKQVEMNAKRLGISIIKTEVKEAQEYEEKYKEKFDRILLDVPCLGIGVIRRKPDIKWQRKEEDLAEITKIQKDVLNTCCKYLKIGGRLVYSTCSILKEENEELIQKFLENKNFKLVEGDQNLIEKFEIKKEKNIGIQLLPNEKHDGFFIAILERIQ